MKRRNGFTLVELLAVIVILAIVLIIAVPGVLSIINKTKSNALDRQKDMIKEASRLYVTSDSDVTWVGQDTKMTTVTLDTLKAKGYLDQKIIDPKTKKEITCVKTVITKTGSKYDYDVTICDQINASPRLSSNMIPIAWNGSTWVKADYTNQDNNWYDYDNQQWANVATVTESTRDKYKKADIGNEIKMEDINTMFVWIPRFKYKLFNVDGTVSPVGNPNMAGDYLIDVQIEEANIPKATGTQNGEWLTHPAFTFGGEELTGIWVGKFETGYNQGPDQTTYTKLGAEQNKKDGTKVLIKPTIPSWRNNKVSNTFYSILSMKDTSNPYGLTSTEDPHMMKNMEWGAMAYLTQSKYGKQGNDAYVGAEKQVRINNNTTYLTGCGADTQDAAGVATCNTYETVNGMSASTTGNITGIYDTSGGAWEMVSGVMKESNGMDIMIANSNFSLEEVNKLAQSGKYFDVYDYGTTWQDRSRGHLGDATIETGPFASDRGAWYQDYAVFVASYEQRSWFSRGVSYDIFGGATAAGIFAYDYGYEGLYTNHGSRAVLI